MGTAERSYDVDVVCVGSGLGGLTAAIAAHEHGGRAIVVEKAAKLGGVCAYSGGEVFVPGNHLLERAEQDLRAAAEYFEFLAAGFARPELAAKLLNNGHRVARFLAEKAGIKWKLIADFPDYHHPHAPGTASTGRYLEAELFDGAELGPWQKKTYNASPHMPPGITHDELFAWGSLSCIQQWDFGLMGQRMASDTRSMGAGMMAAMVKAAMIDRQIPALLETPATQLIIDDGRVIGVYAEDKDGRVRVNARKGVVLGISGYDWNSQMACAFEGFPEWNSMCPPGLDGDNVVLAGELGASTRGVPNYNLGMFFGYQLSGETHGGQPLFRASWEGGYPHAIWVNRAGRRFGDESFYRDYLPTVRQWNGCTQQQDNYPPYLIFDQQYRDKYAFGTFMPGQDIPEAIVAQAETPGALAEKLGVDPAGLESTLDRFNRHAADGVDPDFGRGRYPWAAMMTGDRSRRNPNLGPVDKAPFYGLALRPVGVGINSVGLETNQAAQVLHVRGRPIPGLYAVGNSAAALDTGAGYQSGLSNLRGMTWGYLAAAHALGIEAFGPVAG